MIQLGRFKRPARQEGGNYLSQAEKELLGDEGAITPVNAVTYEAEGGYNGKDRFVLVTEIEGELKEASFGTSPKGSSRDDLLAAMVEQEISTDDGVFVRWEKIEGKGAQAAFINLIPVDEDGTEIEPEDEEEEAEPEQVSPAVAKLKAKAAAEPAATKAATKTASKKAPTKAK